MSVAPVNIIPALSSRGGFLGRLAQAMAPAISPLAPNLANAKTAPSPLPAQLSGDTALTPAVLRAALLELGLNASSDNMALAQSLAQLGLPLSTSMMGEANGALARAPGASPSSFALAKSLNLTPTPAILRALSTVTDGIPAGRALPAEISEWLGLHLDAADLDTEQLAAHLHLMVNARTHSLEQRLLTGTGGNPFHDARALLLRLAQNSRDRQTQAGADTLASHIEGQQLVNGAARHVDVHAPLYVAMPMALPGETSMLELKLWTQDEARDWEQEADDADALRAVVRLATTKLGRVQIELTGTLAGQLTCCVGAEKPAAVRLLTRHREQLASSLCALGWPTCVISCQPQKDWPPLWHGGQQLTAPRVRVDWKA